MAYDSHDEKEQIQIEILNNKVDLDYPCWQCVESYDASGYCGPDGPQRISGFKEGHENGEPCEYCDGKRFQLTDEGEAIMNLVRRHSQAR